MNIVAILFLVGVLIAQSAAVKLLASIPAPLIAVVANRKRNEIKSYIGASKVAYPQPVVIPTVLVRH